MKKTISNDLLLSVVVGTLASAGAITILFQGQQRWHNKISGDITGASGGEPFGGEKMGTVSIDSTGRRTNVSADLNGSPGEGNVFEGWLVDAGGSGYKLSWDSLEMAH